MTTLRELAQAVVDASDAYNAAATHEIMREAMRQQDAAGDALDHATSRLTSYQRARAILAALDADREAPRWQPIETAPRDGQRIVLYVVSPHWKRPEMGLWHRGPEGTGWHQDSERSKVTRGTPTHWQPLPAPPEVTAQREGAEGGE